MIPYLKILQVKNLVIGLCLVAMELNQYQQHGYVDVFVEKKKLSVDGWQNKGIVHAFAK